MARNGIKGTFLTLKVIFELKFKAGTELELN